MSTVAKKIMMGSGATASAYEIDQSAIFDALSYTGLRMSSGNDGNHRKWTWSGWVKKAENLLTSTSHANYLLNSTSADGQILVQLMLYQDTLYWSEYDGGNKGHFQTNRVFRDPAAWYHIVVVYDSAQGSASDRIKPYINGVRETSFAAFINVAQNYDSSINTASRPIEIGNGYGYIDGSQAQYGHNGNIAEVHYLDGTSYDASYFGETNSDTGQWIPKEYTDGNYGTNGFYLKFVSGAIGTDSSGEGNNFTVTNLANADVVTDTPTNNFCTLNFLSNYNATLTQGNLVAAQAGHSDTTATFQIPFTGKWYFECVATTAGAAQLGIAKTSYTVSAGQWGSEQRIINVVFSNGNAGYNAGGEVSYIGSAISNGNTVGVAIDSDNGKIYFAKNNTWGNSGNPLNGTNPAATFTASDGWRPLIYGPSGTVQTFNFGQKDFAYTPPSGFSALSTANLPDPAIAIPSAQFNTVLYTGNGSTQSISGVGHQPDWVWIKNRSAADNNKLTDAVRGVTKEIESNSGDAEATNADGLTAFASDGFALGDDDEYNTNTENYVAWNWKANGAGSTDTSGDIDGTLSANPTAGFSIVNWIPNGTASATIPHGLGVAPDMVFYKRYNGTSSWFCWTTAIDGSNDYLVLNETNAATAVTSAQSGGTSFTSSFIRATNYGASGSPEVVSYCFASKEGFSKIGAYTGNGSAAGPTIVTGFRPALVITKRTDATGYWGIFDAARAPGNVAAFPALFPNTSEAEVTGTYLDLLSNGFKIRITSAHYNASGGTYLYMAFAESPFKTANAR